MEEKKALRALLELWKAVKSALKNLSKPVSANFSHYKIKSAFPRLLHIGNTSLHLHREFRRYSVKPFEQVENRLFFRCLEVNLSADSCFYRHFYRDTLTRGAEIKPFSLVWRITRASKICIDSRITDSYWSMRRESQPTVPMHFFSVVFTLLPLSRYNHHGSVWLPTCHRSTLN
jgi:hypothetical protein